MPADGGLACQVCKPQGQDYQLLWRDTPDFVRMAAKTNALVIPFAVVGAEEAYDIFMDSSQVTCLLLKAAAKQTDMLSSVALQSYGSTAGCEAGFGRLPS